MKRSSIRALLLAALLSVPGAVVADSHLSSDPAVEEARAQVAADQFEPALGLLRTLT